MDVHLQGISFNTDEVIRLVVSHGGRILLIAILAVVIIRLLNGLLTPVLRIAIREQMTDEPRVEVDKRIETLSQVVSRTTATVVVIAALLTALPEIGLNVAPLIAGVGIIGLAVGFGAQNLVRDVINGLFILIENQYGKGDVVEIGGKSGTVEDINLRRTVLRDDDGTVHFVPHGEVKTSSNRTKGFSRISIELALAYSTDVDRAFDTIDRVGAQLATDPRWQDRIREAPRAQGVERFGDAGLQVRIGGVTEPGQQWSVAGELRRRLLVELAREGVRFSAVPVVAPNTTESQDGGVPPAAPPVLASSADVTAPQPATNVSAPPAADGAAMGADVSTDAGGETIA